MWQITHFLREPGLCVWQRSQSGLLVMITYADLVEPKSKVIDWSLQRVRPHRESTRECGVCYAYTRERHTSIVWPMHFIYNVPITKYFCSHCNPCPTNSSDLMHGSGRSLIPCAGRSARARPHKEDTSITFCMKSHPVFLWSLIKSSPSHRGHQHCLPHFREAWV